MRAKLRQTCTVVLCRTGVIHDPAKQTCIFDTEWSSGSSGGARRLLEASEPAECAVDLSEVTHELSEVKQQVRKTEKVQAQELGEAKLELSEVKQQLRKAEQVADDMKRQVGDMSVELREVKALLKQLAAAQ